MADDFRYTTMHPNTVIVNLPGCGPCVFDELDTLDAAALDRFLVPCRYRVYNTIAEIIGVYATDANHALLIANAELRASMTEAAREYLWVLPL